MLILYITCVVRDPAVTPIDHPMAVSAFMTDDGSTWSLASTIAAIERGSHEFRVMDQDRRGWHSVVRVVMLPLTGRKYLRTTPDGTTRDNLGLLRSCL